MLYFLGEKYNKGLCWHISVAHDSKEPPVNPKDFKAAAPGKVVRVAQGYAAFVPNRLPPEIPWNSELASALSAADIALGTLAGVGRTLRNPHLLIGPFKRREAVLSSRIEGTEASLSDLFLFEAAPRSETKRSDVREVGNYVRALEHGLDRLRELPLSLRLIREVHGVLMEGVRGQQSEPGQFRSSQNWIGPPGCSLEEATFVPPPQSEMVAALDAFEKYLHAESELPVLVRLALIHYQFEAIHPFLDGNGRIGRLLISLLLCAQGVLPQPLLYLSAYFEKNRTGYYEGLLKVSREGSWNDWIVFFLRGVHEQGEDAVARAKRLIALHEEYRDQCHVARGSALVLKLVDRLFSSPVITVPYASRFLDVTYASARKSIAKLEALGILREVTGKRRNKIYLAEKILELVE